MFYCNEHAVALHAPFWEDALFSFHFFFQNNMDATATAAAAANGVLILVSLGGAEGRVGVGVARCGN